MLKLYWYLPINEKNKPAAFGRLCVETTMMTKVSALICTQPPSGGCVLKPCAAACRVRLKPQPPSGGCVLKLRSVVWLGFRIGPAAFGRLCVETLG